MPSPAKSLICLSDEALNRARNFGSVNQYVAAWLREPNGDQSPMLFTRDQINVAVERGYNNPEDIGPRPGYWRRLWWALRG